MRISQSHSDVLSTSAPTTGTSVPSAAFKRHPAATLCGFLCIANADGALAVEALRVGGDPAAPADWREITNSATDQIGQPGGRAAVTAGAPATYLLEGVPEIVRGRYYATTGSGTVSAFEAWYAGHGGAVS